MDNTRMTKMCDTAKTEEQEIVEPTTEDAFPPQILFHIPTSDDNSHILVMNFTDEDQDCLMMLRSLIESRDWEEEDTFLICDIPDDGGALDNFLYGTTNLRTFYSRYKDWIVDETWEGESTVRRCTDDDLNNPRYEIPTEYGKPVTCIMAHADVQILLKIKNAGIKYYETRRLQPLLDLQEEFKQAGTELSKNFAETLGKYLEERLSSSTE